MQPEDQPAVVDRRDDRFDRWVEQVEPRLRRALVAAYGADLGRDAAAEALAWAWEHFDRVETMTNPGGYLYRVGQSSTRTLLRRRARTTVHVVEPATEDWLPLEPRLASALAALTPPQRTAVLLIDGWGLTRAEAAATMGCRISTVRTHQRRGLAKLRTELGVDQ